MGKEYPDWVLKHRTKGTAIHQIQGKYYLYEVSSAWNKEKKKSERKTGRSLGRITPQGLQPRMKTGMQASTVSQRLGSISVKEYGLSFFIETTFKEQMALLAEYFPEHWQTLLYVAYCRLVFQSSIRQMPFHVAHSYLSEMYKCADMSEKKISLALRDIGRDRTNVAGFMRQGIGTGEQVLIDMTNIPSKSGQMGLIKAGYDSDQQFNTQFNLLYLYSSTMQRPTFYRLVAGNIREVSAMRLTIQESGVKDCIIIADKGFYSQSNVEELQAEKLRFIIPLKRDNKLIQYELLDESALKNKNQYFAFEQRYVWYQSYAIQGTENHLCLFLDENLKIKEQSDYLRRIDEKTNGYTFEKFLLKKTEFGTMAILSNIKGRTPPEIYAAYKSRMDIENTFDAMKTILEADKTYMQQEDVLQGWMFANHIALQWYYTLYHRLNATKQNSKYSVKDLIEHLREIRIAKIGEEWIRTEVIKKSQQLLDKINLPIV
jgi:Transposase DDE domain